MKATNHLNSHHGESHSSPVRKMGSGVFKSKFKGEIFKSKLSKSSKRFFNKKRRGITKNPKFWDKF